MSNPHPTDQTHMYNKMTDSSYPNTYAADYLRDMIRHPDGSMPSRGMMGRAQLIIADCLGIPIIDISQKLADLFLARDSEIIARQAPAPLCETCENFIEMPCQGGETLNRCMSREHEVDKNDRCDRHSDLRSSK